MAEVEDTGIPQLDRLVEELVPRDHSSRDGIPGGPDASPVFKRRHKGGGILRWMQSQQLLALGEHVDVVELLIRGPESNFLQAGLLPECLALRPRVLQALLHLDSLVLLDLDAANGEILVGCVESLVPTSILVIDVLSDHSPVVEVEDVVVQDAIGVHESIEDESVSDAKRVVVCAVDFLAIVASVEANDHTIGSAEETGKVLQEGRGLWSIEVT